MNKIKETINQKLMISAGQTQTLYAQQLICYEDVLKPIVLIAGGKWDPQTYNKSANYKGHDFVLESIHTGGACSTCGGQKHSPLYKTSGCLRFAWNIWHKYNIFTVIKGNITLGGQGYYLGRR